MRLSAILLLAVLSVPVFAQNPDAISREFTLHTTLLTDEVASMAVSREFTLHTTLLTDEVASMAVSREFTLHVPEYPSKLLTSVDPKATYLRTCCTEPAVSDPLIIDLSIIHAVPGDWLRIHSQGDWSPTGDSGPEDQSGLLAVFSSSDAFLSDPGELHRVPDAIDAGVDHVTAGCPPRGIVNVSDTSVEILDPPPGNVHQGALEIDDKIRVFRERQNHTLSQDATVDISGECSSPPCVYDAIADLPATKPSIPTGTRVDSYLIHVDPVTPPLSIGGSITFDSDILGVMVRANTLDDGDPELGAPGTSYPGPGDGQRAWDLDDGGSVILHDSRSIEVGSVTGAYYDQIRVLVASCPEQGTDIPEDFFVPGGGYVDVQVPEGVTHSFFAAEDTYYSDNVDINGDYTVSIERLPCSDLPYDFDNDGDIDLDDFTIWEDCASGPAVSLSGGCEFADLDGDDDGDQADFGLFQAAYTGPREP